MICGVLEIFLSVAILALVLSKLRYNLTKGICKSHVCLVGKTAIVSGANTGIGYETAKDFAKRGARVILACRNETKAQQAVKRITKETQNTNVHYKIVDFASFRSVREFAKEIIANEERLDILVNNAGAACLGRKLTEDGVPSVFQINYLSHFLLTNLLLDLLKKNPSRVVNVSSILSSRFVNIRFNELTKYNGNYHQYQSAKLCGILFTIEFARKFSGTNVTAYSLHPGVIRTAIFDHLRTWEKLGVYLFTSVFSKTAEEGAQTQIYCSIENGLEKYNGQHFADCHLVERYKTASNPEAARKLWEESEKIVSLKQ